MNDFSMASISKLIVHLVGNKAKDEETFFSSQLADVSDQVTEQHLSKFFFSSFKFDLSYQFVHDADINLNEIYNYSSKIFSNENEFLHQSENIAKHLYDVSTHPNIKRGELYVALIKNCVVDGKSTNILGIFKSETKDVYLDIIDEHEKFNISYKKGINISKLDKGCLICDLGTNLPQKVFIVDTSRSDAYYWKKLFLNAVEITDEYCNTSTVLKTCKQFVKKVCKDIEPTEKITLLNDSVKYFETHDSFEIDNFSSEIFKDQSTSSDFKRYLESTAQNKSYEKAFDISPKAVTAVKKSIKNFIKLDSNVEIRINTKADTIEKIVERGYDNDKQMNYYKIYFKTEE